MAPGGGQHLLEVVQHQQQLLCTQMVLQAGQQRLRRCLVHAKDLRHRAQHEAGIADGGKLYEVDAVDKVVEQIGGGLQRKPRLADAAGSGKGEQVHIFLEEKLLDQYQAVAAAEERAARQREVVPHGGATIAQACTNF